MGCNSSSAAVCPQETDAADEAKKDAAEEAGEACSAGGKAAVDENGRDLPPPPTRPREVREVPDGEDEEDEEVVDIDLEDPEVAQAATKIQAAFRGHRARKQPEQPAEPEEPAMSQPEEPSKEQLDAEFDPNDKELCDAATKIQASFRGHVARKQVTKATDEDIAKDMSQLDTKDGEGKEVDDELADIDLTDPDLHKAATKIQASFRGHKVRKEGPGGENGGQ